ETAARSGASAVHPLSTHGPREDVKRRQLVLTLPGAHDTRGPMRSPRDFGKPLALGAPVPPLEIPVKPSRVIHFFDPSNAKMAAKLPEIAQKSDILLGNLEDAIQADKKEEAREGLVRIGGVIALCHTTYSTTDN